MSNSNLFLRKKTFDLVFCGAEAALEAIGLAAATTVQSLCRLLAKLPYIPTRAHDANAIAAFIRSGIHRRPLLASLPDSVRQISYRAGS